MRDLFMTRGFIILKQEMKWNNSVKLKIKIEIISISVYIYF